MSACFSTYNTKHFWSERNLNAVETSIIQSPFYSCREMTLAIFHILFKYVSNDGNGLEAKLQDEGGDLFPVSISGHTASGLMV